VLRVAGVLMVGAWLLLVLTVDFDSNANATTAFAALTFVVLVTLALVWVAGLALRLVRKARRPRPDIAKP
jgi:Na+/phosphate symporter